ncbi:hypothetical protein ACED51_15635 [Photobacterium swingsii]|uniref:hypothetical protein n=1 Tax=Photobacterium swingsii TaxID=680026 RepID=UPI00352D6600
MSAVIKTTTPFVVKEALLNALSELGYEPTLINEQNHQQQRHSGGLQVGDILTNRNDYYGRQHFRNINARWVLRHDSSQMGGRVVSKEHTNKRYKPVASFLQELEKEYEVQYQKHLKHLVELERQRLEAERKARVEATRQKVIEQARSQGYVVKEKQINGKIQLVCTRSV